MAPHEYKQYKQNKPIMEKICFIYITNNPTINECFIYASTYWTNAPIYYITKAHLSHKKWMSHKYWHSLYDIKILDINISTNSTGVTEDYINSQKICWNNFPRYKKSMVKLKNNMF